MRMKKLSAAVLIALALSLTVALSACGGCNEPAPAPNEAKANAVTAVVWGYEWGPAIPKVVEIGRAHV